VSRLDEVELLVRALSLHRAEVAAWRANDANGCYGCACEHGIVTAGRAKTFDDHASRVGDARSAVDAFMAEMEAPDA
jgi:hypothetical protein